MAVCSLVALWNSLSLSRGRICSHALSVSSCSRAPLLTLCMISRSLTMNTHRPQPLTPRKLTYILQIHSTLSTGRTLGNSLSLSLSLPLSRPLLSLTRAPPPPPPLDLIGTFLLVYVEVYWITMITPLLGY